MQNGLCALSVKSVLCFFFVCVVGKGVLKFQHVLTTSFFIDRELEVQSRQWLD